MDATDAGMYATAREDGHAHDQCVHETRWPGFESVQAYVMKEITSISEFNILTMFLPSWQLDSSQSKQERKLKLYE